MREAEKEGGRNAGKEQEDEEEEREVASAPKVGQSDMDWSAIVTLIH